LAVEGNKEAKMLLDHIGSIVDQGRVSAVAIIYSDNSGVDSAYVAQSGISETWLNLGLDLCKTGMMKKLMARQAPASDTEVGGPRKANRAIFNAQNLTLGYDFLAWLVAAEMNRIKHKEPGPLEIGFAVGPDWAVRPKDKIIGPQWDFDHMMMDNVALPLVKMIGAVPATKVDETFYWPTNSCFRGAVDLYDEGIAIPKLSHDSAAALAMAKHKGKITITLREATHWTQRNSRLGEWLEIADWLRDEQGEEVLFIRDTAKASEPIQGFKTEPMASTDINCRAAVYAGAKCNLFISNGPGTLDWFCGDTPSLMFIPLSKTDDYKCSDPDWWEAHHGIPARSQFPWFPEHKKIIWEQATFDVVTEAYTELMANGKVKRRAS
jgi:hypothetical protein